MRVLGRRHGLALQLIGRGRLLPGVSPGGYDAWRIGPLDREDVVRVQELAAATPPDARAEPLPGKSPLELPHAEPLVRAFLDAVADALARTPAGTVAASEETWTAHAPRKVAGPPRGGPKTSQPGSTRASASPCASSFPARTTCRATGQRGQAQPGTPRSSRTG